MCAPIFQEKLKVYRVFHKLREKKAEIKKNGKSHVIIRIM